LEHLAASGVVASKIYSAEDIMDDPTYAERNDIITVDDEDLGPVRMQAVVPSCATMPAGSGEWARRWAPTTSSSTKSSSA